MILTDAESRYLQDQRWGRLATVGPDGTLQNSPVGFDFDPQTETVAVHGYGTAASRKDRNVAENGRTAVVVDDVPSLEPMRASVRTVEPQRP